MTPVDGDEPTPEQAEDFANDLSSTDPAVGLRAVVALRQLLEQIERLHIDNAREAGWSWQHIATALRVSKQAVHEKHSTRRKAMGKEP